MARETKEQLAARVRADNAAAAALPTGAVVAGFFGETRLGVNQGPGKDGWDNYEVQHSGAIHVWSSATVTRTFGGT